MNDIAWKALIVLWKHTKAVTIIQEMLKSAFILSALSTFIQLQRRLRLSGTKCNAPSIENYTSERKQPFGFGKFRMKTEPIKWNSHKCSEISGHGIRWKPLTVCCEGAAAWWQFTDRLDPGCQKICYEKFYWVHGNCFSDSNRSVLSVTQKLKRRKMVNEPNISKEYFMSWLQW
jgi:hypothetical protein